MKDVVEVASLTPEQAEILARIFLATVKKEAATTSRVLHAVPVEKCNYRPHENSRSAIEMAWHLASVDIWFLRSFLTGKFEMEDDEESVPADTTPADIASLYDDAFAIKIEKVKKLTPEFWATRIPFFGMYNQPAVLYLQFMLNHAIHHRGQLVAYLRPMGAKVPNIYGGSFDEPMEFTHEE
ncbi:MAG: DinB family protein [Candidatus Acidiferrales bacterium]|jgi:uncharacterized damage-inducible protein DinB